jgi:hypothetical protein
MLSRSPNNCLSIASARILNMDRADFQQQYGCTPEEWNDSRNETLYLGVGMVTSSEVVLQCDLDEYYGKATKQHAAAC